ncbi:MAG: hypothetical protein IKI50_01350, partial [Clostridia bacterium]|nr:hypothetical protein [Clostridia bacterium]
MSYKIYMVPGIVETEVTTEVTDDGESKSFSGRGTLSFWSTGFCIQDANGTPIIERRVKCAHWKLKEEKQYNWAFHTNTFSLTFSDQLWYNWVNDDSTDEDEDDVHFWSKNDWISTTSDDNRDTLDDDLCFISLEAPNSEQIQYITNACHEINAENDRLYTLKAPEEDRLVKIVKRKHYNAFLSFLIKKTNNSFLRNEELTCIYSNLTEFYFGRISTDLKWGWMIGYFELEVAPFNKVFDLLKNYLAATIDQARTHYEDIPLSYSYIVWQALADVATDYYAEEFAKKHSGDFFTIDDMAKELTRENCSDGELMQAVYYLFKHNPETKNFFELHDQLVEACKKEQE